jgi:hypothetical protein
VPFTLSHPAAIAPLWPAARRLRLPLAALAVGAMAPDFEFFLHLRPLSRWSHTLSGLVTFCLPAGFAVYLAWELCARRPVRALLALPAEAQAEPPAWRSAIWWLRAVAALLLGAATHLAWDGVTHRSYWGAQRWPWLLEPALTVAGHPLPWFYVLQQVSTVLGGAVVLAWLGATLHRAGALTRLRRSRWRLATLSGVALLALLVGGWNAWRWGRPSDLWTARVAVGRLAVGALLGLGGALLGFSAAFRLRQGSRLSTP